MQSPTDLVKEMKEDDEEIIEAREATPDESRWFDYILQLPFKSSANITSFADKMMGLNTALIAAYIAGLKLTQSSIDLLDFLPVISLFLSLCLSLWSVFPTAVRNQVLTLAAIEEGYFRGLSIRYKKIRASVMLFLAGIVSGSILLVI